MIYLYDCICIDLLCKLVMRRLVSLFQGYFWAYDAASGRCEPRDVTTVAMATLWSVWSWSTEMFIFLLVPVAALLFNVLVIVEVRRISNTSPSSCSNSRTARNNRSVVRRQKTFMLSVPARAYKIFVLKIVLDPIKIAVQFSVCFQSKVSLKKNPTNLLYCSAKICNKTVEV